MDLKRTVAQTRVAYGRRNLKGIGRSAQVNQEVFRMGLETLGPFYLPARVCDSDIHKLQASTCQLIAARQALCQALNKTRELGSMLDKSEDKLRTISERLPPLEKEMAPLLTKRESVRCLVSQIEEAVAPAKSVLERFDEVHDLEVTLMREPKENLDGYLAAVMQLEDCLGYLQENSGVAIKLLQETVDAVMQTDLADMARVERLRDSLKVLKAHRAGEPASSTLDGGLLCIAQEKLVKEFKRLVEHTLPLTLPERIEVPPEDSVAPSVTRDLTEQILLPNSVLSRVHDIMDSVGTNGGLEKCVEAYRDIRSTRAFVSLQGLKLDYLKTTSPEALNKMDWDILQTMIGFWVQHIEVAVKVLYASERRLSEQVLGHGRYIECFYKVARIGMLQFISFGEGVACGHRAPEKLFKLLDMFEVLDKFMPIVNVVFEGECCVELRSRIRELQKMVVSGACNTFWEFRQWVVEQNDGSLPPDGSVTRLSSYVVNYLKYLVSDTYSPIMDRVLKIEQNWRGQGRPEDRGLANGLLQFMQALERQVEGRSREYPDLALRHIFMMNNLWYMRIRAKKCELGSLLGEAWLTDQRHKVEQHALQYEHEVWGGVLKLLSREGINGQGGRNALRDNVLKRLRDFTASFEHAVQRHHRWVISEEDLRQGTKAAVVHAVVPSYKSFINSYRPSLDNGSGSNLKYTPETVEHMLNDLLDGSQGLSRAGSSGKVPSRPPPPREMPR